MLEVKVRLNSLEIIGIDYSLERLKEIQHQGEIRVEDGKLFIVMK